MSPKRHAYPHGSHLPLAPWLGPRTNRWTGRRPPSSPDRPTRDAPINRHRPIVLLVVAALLPLVALSAALGILSLRQQQDVIEREALTHVQRVSTLLERELTAHVEILRTLANSPLLDGPLDEAAFTDWAQRTRRDLPLWLAVVLSDPRGNRIVDVPEPVTGIPRGRVVDEASHARAVETSR